MEKKNLRISKLETWDRWWIKWLLQNFSMSENIFLRTVRRAAMFAMPLLLAAALALLVKYFPLDVYQRFMFSTFGASWDVPCNLLYNGTIEILGLAVSLSLSFQLLEEYNQRYPLEAVSPIAGSLIVLSVLTIMIGPEMLDKQMVLPWIGMRGLFGSLLITSLAVYLFLRFYRCSCLRFAFYPEDVDPLLPQVFATLIPGLLTLLVFLFIRLLLMRVGIPSLHQAIYTILQYPFIGAQDSFGLGILYTFLVQVCWFLGIHGPDLLDPITHDIFHASMAANSVAFNASEAPIHMYTRYLFDTFVHIGGAGATFALIIAIFISSNDLGTRRVGGVSFVPGLFNINEILLFGLPIVFNPLFLIPFMLVPLLLLSVSTGAILLGLVPQPVFSASWTTPPLINAYLVTGGSFAGVALQVFNLFLGTVCYMPFVQAVDKRKYTQRMETFHELCSLPLCKKQGGEGKQCTDLPGAPGLLARSLGNQLLLALETNSPSIMLYYQPRVNLVKKNVYTVEGLLRWQHPVYGIVPAPLTLALADDLRIGSKLDKRILQVGIQQLALWRNKGIELDLALNTTERQLLDTSFLDEVSALFERYDLPSTSLIFEVDEALAFDPTAKYLSALEKFHHKGIRLAVDDFGKSLQSLSILKQLPLTDIQIHEGLIDNIAYNKSCQSILATIQDLCAEMNITITAEHIESQEQLETLLELNFSTFQGFWFQKPVTAEECERFIVAYGD